MMRQAISAYPLTEVKELPEYMAKLRDTLQAKVLLKLGGEDGMGVRVNGPVDDAKRLPNTLSVGVRGLSASVLLAELSEQVAASAGAACHTAGRCRLTPG